MPKKKKGHDHWQTNQSGKRADRAAKHALRRERKRQAIRQRLSDKEFVSFDNQLQAQGLTLKDVLGDGNCLFRALSNQLDGDRTKHEDIRQAVVQYMKANRDDFEPFLDEDEPFDQYLTDLAKDGTYGGNDAIVAFSRRFELDVIIHQLSAPCLEVLCPVRLQASASPRALHIAYLYGDHYCSVRPVGASKESGPVMLPPARTGEKPVSKTLSQASKYDTSVPSPCSVSSSVAKETDDPQLEELLMLTGCEDSVLAQECLLDAGYDLSIAAPLLLQLMEVSSKDDDDDDDDDGTEDSNPSKTHPHSESSKPHAQDESSKPQPHSEPHPHNESSKPHPQGESSKPHPQGESSKPHSNSDPSFPSAVNPHPKMKPPKSAKQQPKQPDASQHLSNKKRKERAKQERKKRRIEEKREKHQDLSEVPEVTITMGSLAI